MLDEKSNFVLHSVCLLRFLSYFYTGYAFVFAVHSVTGD